MNNSENFAVHVVGHEWAIDLLKQQHKNGRVPQSLLIAGSPNIGKSSVARYFGQYLNCQGDTPPCGTCISCRKVISGNHPDVRILDEEQPLKIEQVRTLQRMLSLSPVEGRYRVVLLSNFERATISAANALLKTLEEPASQVVIILTTPDPAILLPTIVSRCQVLTLRPLPEVEILQALQSRWQARPEQAELLTQLAAGRLGWAVRALTDEDFIARRTQYKDDFLDLLQMHRAERLAYAYAMSRNVAILKEALTLWLTIWRDLLLLKSGAQTKIINLDWQNNLQTIAQKSSIIQAKDMVVRIQTALINLERNVNPRLSLEIVLLKLPFIIDL